VLHENRILCWCLTQVLLTSLFCTNSQYALGLPSIFSTSVLLYPH
jgi:hypothetical protein